MATLVTAAGFDEVLGGTVAAESAYRANVLDRVLARFHRETARTSIPFVDAQTARVEYRDGVGSNVLFLDYAITTLTSITLGFDHSNPTETLVVADLLYAAGSRRVVRQSGCFGYFGAPRYIKITYDAAADLPIDAADAIYQMAAAEFRGRGSEGVKSETMGPYSVTFKDAETVDPTVTSIWSEAVAAHMRVV